MTRSIFVESLPPFHKVYDIIFSVAVRSKFIIMKFYHLTLLSGNFFIYLIFAFTFLAVGKSFQFMNDMSLLPYPLAYHVDEFIWLEEDVHA